jgi:23S rRNA (adenine2503-C2)-methyltransferase
VVTAQRRPDIAELERSELESALAERGHARFHARQIFSWVYRRGVNDAAAMTDLSRELRATLAREFSLTTPTLAHRETSVDGTEKFLLRLADGRHIESVFIPDTPAMTFCISTQVGCAMACAFCPHWQDGARSQPDGCRDRRAGPSARRRSSTCATRASTSC